MKTCSCRSLLSRSRNIIATLTLLQFVACGGGGDGDSSTSLDGGAACLALGFQKSLKLLNGAVCPLNSASDTSSVVKIEVSNGNGSSGVCTGTVIAPRAVLTAAHCFASPRTGAAVITSVNGARSRVSASSIIVHPGFTVNSGGFFLNDVAVLRFSNPLPAPTTPVLLSRSANEGESGIVAGYGQTSPDSSTTDELYAGGALIRSVTENHIRIDYTENESHPCRGDSGGALFVTTDQGLAIVGVVSQSDPSVPADTICEIGDKTLYTNVENSSVSSFIASVASDAAIR